MSLEDGKLNEEQAAKFVELALECALHAPAILVCMTCGREYPYAKENDELKDELVSAQNKVCEFAKDITQLKDYLSIAQKRRDDDRAEALQFYHQVRNALGLPQTYEIDYTTKLSDMVLLIKAAVGDQQILNTMREQLIKMLETVDGNDGGSY